jgi:hypothetical protein
MIKYFESISKIIIIGRTQRFVTRRRDCIDQCTQKQMALNGDKNSLLRTRKWTSFNDVTQFWKTFEPNFTIVTFFLMNVAKI